MVLLPYPTQSRLQARRLWEPSMVTRAPLSSLVCVDATCKIFSILSICPTSSSTHPPLLNPKNTLSKFQWDQSLSACRTLRRVCMISSVSSAFAHSALTSALGSAVLCLRPPSSRVANPSPPHPDSGQAHLPPWGSAWLFLESPQIPQAGNCSLDLHVASIAERTLSVLPGLVTLGLAQASLDPTPSEDSIWGLAWSWENVGSRWDLISKLPFQGGSWGERSPT